VGNTPTAACTPHDQRKQGQDQNNGETPARKSRACTDLFDLLLATGCRIGEACALRWQDIDLHAGTLTVAGTMVFLRDTGWERQDFPKTAAGQRTVYLPPFALTMLRRRQSEEPHRRDDPLFASRAGTFVQPDNMRCSEPTSWAPRSGGLSASI
jgi:integrase